MLIQSVRSSRIRPGPFALIATIGLVCLFAGSSAAFACFSDPECDDGSTCTGVEWCDLGGGSPGSCMSGTPIVCDDSDPCTADYCVDPAGTCDYFPTPDDEAAAGPDGLCDTADDNIDLYGIDGQCGTGDDTTGDGICSLLDNCDGRSNPGQEDADRDGYGDACDATPCQVRGLYTFAGWSLIRVDPATGEYIYITSGFSNPRDVAINANDTQAVVTGTSPDTIYVVDLTTGTIASSVGMSDPWGIDLGDSSGQAYFNDYGGGNLWGWDLYGGLWPIAFGLLDPTGLDANAAETLAYVAEESGGQVSSVNLSSGVITLIGSTLTSPTDVALDPAETDLYVIEPTLGRLTQVNISSGLPTPIATGLSSPEGLALNAAGTIGYVNESSLGYSWISEVDLTTGVVTPVTYDPMMPMTTNDGLALSPKPPVVLTVPEGELGIPSATVTVPVNVDDVTGLGILSIDFTVEFNPAVVTATSVSTGTLTSGCTLTDNLTVQGQATVSVFCTAALTGSGSIAEIDFNVGGSRGQGSPVLVTSVLLNEGTPAVCGDAGSFEVPVEIDGTVVYYRDESTSSEPSTKPVDAADFDLDRLDWDDMYGPVYNTIDNTATDCSGDYSFISIPPILTYRVTPSKTADFEGAIDPFDAALNAQHVVGLTTLTANQSLAADVTGNGTLSSFDSAHIAQFSVALITQFPVATLNSSDWTFVPAPQVEPNQTSYNPYPAGASPGRIEYSPITESAENQDFHAILFGDVSGNWTGVCGAFAPPPESLDRFPADAVAADGRSPGGEKAKGQGLVSLPNLRAAQGEEIRVPIRAEGAAEAIAFLLDLRYDPAVLELLGTAAGNDAGSFQLQANTSERGRARMALFSAAELDRDGEIAVVRFRVIGTPRSRTELTLATSRVNEGRIPVVVREGRVVVSPRSPKK